MTDIFTLRSAMRLLHCLIALACLHGAPLLAFDPEWERQYNDDPRSSCTSERLQHHLRCNDAELVFSTRLEVSESFGLDKFDLLEQRYGQWCAGKERFPDGRWKLSQFTEGLEETFRGLGHRPSILARIKRWQQAFPESEAPLYAEALYWNTRAWAVAHADGVEARVLFKERMAKARAILDSIGEKNFRCAALYPLLIDVQFAQRAEAKDVERVFRRAARKFPQYHGIYFAAAKYFSPRWGGNPEAYERFASDVAARTKGFEGMGMYARLYWIEDFEGGLPFGNTPSRPPYWEKLKAGYEDLARRYPDSMHNLGKFAGVACRSTDSELYLALRKKIDGYEGFAQMSLPVDVCDLRHGWATSFDNAVDLL